MGDCVTSSIMREWMRERMRRRSKRGPNTSESTGKIGQEIPANQPAPLRPTYPEAQSQAEEAAEPHDEVAAEPIGVFADAGEEPEDAAVPEAASTDSVRSTLDRSRAAAGSAISASVAAAVCNRSRVRSALLPR